MNKNSEIRELLQKFITNECSEKEIDKVVAYFQDNKLTDDFPSVEDVINYLDQTSPIDASAADRILFNVLSIGKEIEEKKIRRRKVLHYTSIAASIIILFSIGWTFQDNLFKPEIKSVIDPNAITLQLANGEVQIISSDKNSQVTDSEGNVVGNQNGNQIVYDDKTDSDKLMYNIIKIPYGKRFELVLSDGTLVHLNSGTTLRYPVKFIKGENRQVFLEGEAFFDVAKDKKHPFVVNADNLNIRVLGTHFNVSNYPEDELTDVVLVEGSVGMYTSDQSFDAANNTVLKPGFKGSYNKKNSNINTKRVLTDSYTSWMQGKLVFKNMAFKDISKKLERHYDVTILNKNRKLENEKFYASFGDEPIEKILSYFNEIHGIKYTIKNTNITIN